MKDISENDKKNNLPLVTRPYFDRQIYAGNIQIAMGGRVIIMAGPCTVEGRAQIFEIAHQVKEAGGDMLRGGVFKSLTFPYNDPLNRADLGSNDENKNPRTVLSLEKRMGIAERRYAYFKEAGEKYGLPIVSEIVNVGALSMMEKYVDMLQIGYRQMFNMDIIEAVAQSKKPVLIKRHAGQSLRDVLGVCEHYEARGKSNFAVAERGVVAPFTHNSESRFIIDIQAIPALNEYAPSVPVIVDPSHATFKREYVGAVARAAVAAGADGLLIEVHSKPEEAWVDPLQALNFKNFEKLVKEIRGIAKILGRE